MGPRKAECPNCGGPIEWSVGHSVSTICKWCSFSVVRSDRDIRAIGKVADLVPTAAPLAVGDIGKITLEDGTVQGFTVAGRLQLDHGNGPWDEWYVSMSRNRWGWLARAQGRWYLTMPASVEPIPPIESLQVGFTGPLRVDGQEQPWVIAEIGRSTVLSAEGELPVPVVPGEQSQYVDLQGPNDGFGTIDYGNAGDYRDGSEPPATYFGRGLPAGAISWRDGGQGPRPTEAVQVSKLECPSCGAPVEIRAPDITERAACGHCNGLLDFESGHLKLLETLRQERITPALPLGQQGKLRGQDLTVIGFMERFTVVDGMTYAWREYLLYGTEGYRWLMEDSGHWTLLEVISAADVEPGTGTKRYQGRTYKLFGINRVSVRYVVGEFYWKVRVGDRAKTVDYIAPPHLLSEERTDAEMVWSHGEYIPYREIEKAFSPPGGLQTPYDVAPAQPNPVSLTYPLIVTAVFAALLIGVFLTAKAARPSEKTLATVSVPMPTLPTPRFVATRGGLDPALSRTSANEVSSIVGFSEPFTLSEEVKDVQLQLKSTLGSGWLGVAVALIEEQTGEVWEASLEYGENFHTSGVDRTRAEPLATQSVGALPAGRYVVRTESSWSRKNTVVGVSARAPASNFVVVRRYPQPVDSGCLCISIFLLCSPLGIAIIRQRVFESRRWRNANLGGA